MTMARVGAALTGLALILAVVGPGPAGADVTIDFDAGDGDTLDSIGEDFASLGVHFGPAWVYYNDDGPNGTGGDYPAKSDPNSAYGPQSPGTYITFDDPVTFFSFWYNDALNDAVFNAWPNSPADACVLCDEILAINVPNGPTFVSYSPPSATRYIQFFAGDLTIDDLTFRTVPTPTSLMLLTAGLAALAGLSALRRP